MAMCRRSANGWDGGCRDLHEATLELAIVVRLIHPGAEDECSTRRENRVVEVRQALDRGVSKALPDTPTVGV
jgi:hypothetical protein